MIKGAIVLILFCAGLGAQDSGFYGVAVDSATGRPLPGVHVMAITIAGSGLPKVYGAISDSGGRFSMAKMPAGSYFYMGERTGYVSVRKGGGPNGPPAAVTLKSGEPLRDFKLEMTPRAVIAGRVLDDFGDPVQYVQMQATPVSPDAPVAVLMSGGYAATDDRGEFRLIAAPGKYYVKASPQTFGQQRPAEIRTDGSSPATYATTYYPSSVTTDRATPVEVAAGADARIEIRLARPRGGSFAGITGIVSGIPDKGGSAMVSLRSGETADRLFNGQSSSVGPDGRFSFRNLQPGYHRLSASYSAGGSQLRSQSVEFADTNAPSHVELVLKPGGEISGTFQIAGAPKSDEKRTVTLQSSVPQYDNASATGTIDADGSFRIPNVFPGKYRVTVKPLPENAYLKSVELDGAAVADEDLDLTRGVAGSRLKIIASPNGAEIGGNVLDQDGTKIGGTVAIVLLLRDLKKIRIDEDHAARVMGTGTYSFKALRPGKYWILAIDAFRTAGYFEDDSALQKLAGSAAEVEVKESDRIAKDVRTAVGDANAKPKQ